MRGHVCGFNSNVILFGSKARKQLHSLLWNTHKVTYTISRLCGGLVTRLIGRREPST
ncbi:protein of unknown function [Methylotuvimicrobium alcaliphilum 20Z]|uniref:Uncharacterized protein n=1 Tax=Methylotuvimicrobium alcaliphilum (strain DSM 19304 / NCIMB 14124 / VKM B-2133 / 20Z) TaxID=1091494 RepID=G4T1I0_META2|nr:protein of unknown function [Methylotuvimicrobium alcaliphilum 20Z]